MQLKTLNNTPVYLNVINKSNSKRAVVQSNSYDNRQVLNLPASYHSNMFKAHQNVSKLSFKKAIIHEGQLQKLTGALSKICDETIARYHQHDQSIRTNDFTRCYIHHCFDFVPKHNDFTHNLNDPLAHSSWTGYLNFKRKTMADGQTMESVYYRKMTEHIDSWNEKFINIITKEKEEGKNNLIDELLSYGEDVHKIKKRLGIIQ